jgi:hypothetical protein
MQALETVLETVDNVDVFMMAVYAALPGMFLVGLIVGGESIAAGQPTFPPVMLPGWRFADVVATEEFLVFYRRATKVTWTLVGALLVVLGIQNRDLLTTLKPKPETKTKTEDGSDVVAGTADSDHD